MLLKVEEPNYPITTLLAYRKKNGSEVKPACKLSLSYGDDDMGENRMSILGFVARTQKTLYAYNSIEAFVDLSDVPEHNRYQWGKFWWEVDFDEDIHNKLTSQSYSMVSLGALENILWKRQIQKFHDYLFENRNSVFSEACKIASEHVGLDVIERLVSLGKKDYNLFQQEIVKEYYEDFKLPCPEAEDVITFIFDKDNAVDNGFCRMLKLSSANDDIVARHMIIALTEQQVIAQLNNTY